MASAARYLTFFFIALNVFSLTLTSTGVAAAMGINPGPSSDTISNQADQDNLESGAPTSDTLFGLYNVVTSQLSGLFTTIYPGLDLLARAGTPEFLITLVGGLVSPIIAFDVISFLRGYAA